MLSPVFVFKLRRDTHSVYLLLNIMSIFVVDKIIHPIFEEFHTFQLFCFQVCSSGVLRFNGVFFYIFIFYQFRLWYELEHFLRFFKIWWKKSKTLHFQPRTRRILSIYFHLIAVRVSKVALIQRHWNHAPLSIRFHHWAPNHFQLCSIVFWVNWRATFVQPETNLKPNWFSIFM